MPKLYVKPEDGGCLPLSSGATDIEHHDAPEACSAEFVYTDGRCEAWETAVFEDHRCVFYRDVGKYIEVVNKQKDLVDMGVKEVVLTNTYTIEVNT